MYRAETRPDLSWLIPAPTEYNDRNSYCPMSNNLHARICRIEYRIRPNKTAILRSNMNIARIAAAQAHRHISENNLLLLTTTRVAIQFC